MEPSKRITVSLDNNVYIKIQNIFKENGDSLSEVVRQILEIGLARDFVDTSKDIIAEIVRKQMEIVIKPYIEILAKISSKTGHMAATSTF